MFGVYCEDQTSKSLVWDLQICFVFVRAGFSSQFIINRKLKLHRNSIEKIFSRNIINNTAEASYHNTLNIKIYRRNSNTSAYFNLTNKYLILIKRFLSNNSSSCFYFLPFNISGSRSDHLQVVTYTLDLGPGHFTTHHIIPSLAPDRQSFLLSLKIIQISEQWWYSSGQGRVTN